MHLVPWSTHVLQQRLQTVSVMCEWTFCQLEALRDVQHTLT